ncbi:MAG: hypothetical protein EOS55_28545 [Mesorhizobium sp.]|nr:MAG: hypothetical protein EOS55_28545 [Mesorhizobium sp.]
MGQRPPLACRPSPPQGGRLDLTTAFANLYRQRESAEAETANLPPEGEMSGRTEGGAGPSALKSSALSQRSDVAPTATPSASPPPHRQLFSTKLAFVGRI